MTKVLENMRKRRSKLLVMLAANQMNEQPLKTGLFLKAKILVIGPPS